MDGGVNLEAVGELARMIRWSGVLTSAIVVAVAWVVLRFLKVTVDRISAQFATQRLLMQKLLTAAQFVIYISTTTMVIVLSFNLSPQVLALLGGTVAVAVGFAIKDVVASFIAGVLILIDRPFQVGDRVQFGGQYGDITGIGLRSVRMQTLDDNTVTIPNNKFLNEITSCGNYGALDMQVVIDFFIGADQDVVRAKDLITEAAITSRYVHLPKPVVVLVKQVLEGGYLAVRLRLKAYVLDLNYEKAFESDVNLRVIAALRAADIRPPAMLHRSADGGAVPVQAAALALPGDVADPAAG